MKIALQILLLAVLASQITMAQTDPPSRTARLSYLDGSVSFQAGTVQDWAPATINRPLTSGDGLWADEGARAELQVGGATLWLSQRTGVSFLNLDDTTTQIRLDRGTIKLSLRQLLDGDTWEVDTPNVAFTLRRAGDYRFEVNEPGDLTVVTTRGGEGEAAGGGQTFPLRPDSRARVTGTDSIHYVVDEPAPPDSFDAWCDSRQRRQEQSESARYVSRETVGYQDLDEYGSWSSDPEYGPVWAPRTIAAGWAPYRYGHWVWIDPWGWTWIDSAPWGFAPFHYGRWAYARRGWVWVPGPVVPRPVYAPALVAWVGGSGFKAGVAWFPLGPREVYAPVYRASPVYVRRVNVTTVNITNVNVTRINYVNRTHVTVVSRETFVGARPVAQSIVRVSPDAITRAHVSNTVNISPQRASVLGYSGPPPRFVRSPAPMTRTVVTRATPPPARVPFSQQERELAKSHGRPLDSSELARIQPTAARHPNVRPADRGPSGQVNPPVRRPPGQPGEVRAQSAGSGSARPAANSREARAEERRLKQEQQQRERQQQQDLKRQQQAQRQQQSQRERRAEPSRQQRTYPDQQRTQADQQRQKQQERQPRAQAEQQQRSRSDAERRTERNEKKAKTESSREKRKKTSEQPKN